MRFLLRSVALLIAGVLLMGLSASLHAQNTFLSDNFTDTAGVLLEAHTASGVTWTKVSSSTSALQIRSGGGVRQTVGSATSNYIAAAPTPVNADYTFAASILPQAGTSGNISVGVRTQSNGVDGYFLIYQSGINVLSIFKLSGGAATYTEISSETAFTATTGTAFTLELDVAGSALTGKLNGTTIATATDSTYASGTPSLFAYNSDSVGSPLDTHGFAYMSVVATQASVIPTITFNVSNQGYPESPFTVSATSNSPGAFTYSVVSGPATISGSTVTLTGAGTVVLQASEAASGIYAAATQNATFSSIAGTIPTITFNIANQTYPESPFPVSASSPSSGAFTYSVVSGPATISGSTVTLTGTGTVVLQASQAAAGSYLANTQNASFIAAPPISGMTPITATSVQAGPTPTTGTLCLTAVDRYGNPISVTKSGGGYFIKGRPFCQNLIAGALSGSLQVPNSATDSAAGHGYSMVIYDSVSKLSSDPQTIFGISGPAWSLDTYSPPVTVSTTTAFTFTAVNANPTGACAVPALWDNDSTNILFLCGADLAWHAPSGSGSGAMPSTPSTASGTKTITLVDGGAAYDVTLSANTAFAFATSSFSGHMQEAWLFITPAGFTPALPSSSGTLLWPGGTPPTVSSSFLNIIHLVSKDGTIIAGGVN